MSLQSCLRVWTMPATTMTMMTVTMMLMMTSQRRWGRNAWQSSKLSWPRTNWSVAVCTILSTKSVWGTRKIWSECVSCVIFFLQQNDQFKSDEVEAAVSDQKNDSKFARCSLFLGIFVNWLRMKAWVLEDWWTFIIADVNSIYKEALLAKFCTVTHGVKGVIYGAKSFKGKKLLRKKIHGWQSGRMVPRDSCTALPPPLCNDCPYRTMHMLNYLFEGLWTLFGLGLGWT